MWLCLGIETFGKNWVEGNRLSLKKSDNNKALLFLKVIVPGLLLLAWAMVGAARGVDLSDTTYAIANYEFLDRIQGSWIYATYLSNLLGRGFFVLSGGKLLIMNILGRLVPWGMAFMVFLFLRKRFPGQEIPIFAGVWLALSMMIIPPIILYHYLSYMTGLVGAILLYRWSETAQRRWLIVAGMVLGMGLWFRVSNLVYAALIFFVLYIDRKELAVFWRDLPAAIGGYGLGILGGLFLLVMGMAGGGEGLAGVAEGLENLGTWILGLLGGGAGSDGGYTLQEMLLTVVQGYIYGIKWLIPMLAVLAITMSVFLFRPGKWLWAKRGIALAGNLFLMFYYTRRGAANLYYRNTGAIYGIGVLFLVCSLGVFLWTLWGRKETAIGKKELQPAAMAALLLLLLTPMGSNNHLYSCINNLFFVAPVSLLCWGQCLKRKEEWRVPLRMMGLCFLLFLLLQGSLFHWAYSFKDGEDGTARDAVMTEDSVLKGMHTGTAHGESLEGIRHAWREEAKGQRHLITYGNIPGMHYILGVAPALSNMWPDLASFSYESFAAEITQLESIGSFPPVILCEGLQNPEGLSPEDKKLSLLQDFLYNNGYLAVYTNWEYTMYVTEEKQ